MTVKRQHHTPRSYLNRFTREYRDAGGSAAGTVLKEDGSAYVYDKQTGKSFDTGVENIAVTSFFYDLPPEIEALLGGPQAVEKSLASREGDWSRAVQDLLGLAMPSGSGARRHRRIPKRIMFQKHTALKAELSRFLAIQYLRTPGFRQLMASRQEREGREDADAWTSQAIAEWITGDQFEKSAADVAAGFWIIHTNDGTEPLYTSDHPVVGWFEEQRAAVLGGQSAFPASMVLALPLAYDAAVTVLEPRYWANYRLSDYDKDARYFHGFRVPLTETYLRQFNPLQGAMATRQVVSPTEPIALESIYDLGAKPPIGEAPTHRQT